VIDVILLLTLFSVSVACAVRESQLTTYSSVIYNSIAVGAFAAAAVSSNVC
jgi:hypothetical protein